MNPFSHIDPYNIQFNTSNDGFMPPVSLPVDMVATSSVNTTPDMIGLSTIDNDIMANIPLSQAPFYPPMSNNVHSISPNMMDNQMVMMMMQQQQQQQQQQQYNMLLQQQQQQQQLQQQLHLQQQQHTFQPPQKRPSFQARQPPQQQHINTRNPSPQWFMKQQQAKMLAAQEKLKSAGVPSPSYSASPSPMHSSPLLDSSSSPQVAAASIINTATIPSSSSVTTMAASAVPQPQQESDTILGKRVELVLTINQEIIRLLLEHQQPIMDQREPDLTLYKNRLQTNLTYLATMADISMTKPDENLKIPNPPDLSPLPPPFTLTAQKIHKLLASAQQLFPPSVNVKQPPPPFHMMDEPSISPYPQRQQQQQQRQFQLQQQQMMMMRQQQQLQQQQMRQSGMNSVGSNNSSSSSSFNSIMSPQQMHHALLSKNSVENQPDVLNPFLNEETLSMMYPQ